MKIRITYTDTENIEQVLRALKPALPESVRIKSGERKYIDGKEWYTIYIKTD